jgi:hypothetical protein
MSSSDTRRDSSITGIYQARWVGEVVDGNNANKMSSRLSRTAITDKSDGNPNT